MDAELPFVGPELIVAGLGAFDLLEFLGAGRFGETYRAVRGDDEYALKICHFLPAMPEYLWEREVTAQQRVSHPNIVRFRRAGHMHARDRRYPYMECEYIAGGDVAGRIAAGVKPPTPAALRALLVGLLQGVKELHDLGILHRDIKPANVALRSGQWAQPALLDFGLAQAFCYSAAHQRLSLASRRPDLAAVAAVVYGTGTGLDPADPGVQRPPSGVLPRRRRAPLDPRELSLLFDADVAELLLRLLVGRHRLGATEALRALGGE